MSYVDEVYELVVAKNPAQPEFHSVLMQSEFTGILSQHQEADQQSIQQPLN